MLSRDEYLAEWSRGHGDTPTDSAASRCRSTPHRVLSLTARSMPRCASSAAGALPRSISART